MVSALTVGAMVPNAMTARAEAPRAGAWEPWVWEGTSAATLVLVAWLPGLAVLATRRQALSGAYGWPRIVGLHVAAVLLFSMLHVLGMTALREALYAAAGETYHHGVVDRFVYEFRKDLVSYGIVTAIFWLALRERKVLAARGAPPAFDITDGVRVIRTSVDEILAATSAGNYVEFVLADGRRPLMRTTLKAMEAGLEDSGFVRIHRCWLINANRVTGLRRQSSGDWTVELGGGASAPLSRRYSHALVKLKSQGAPPAERGRFSPGA